MPLLTITGLSHTGRPIGMPRKWLIYRDTRIVDYTEIGVPLRNNKTEATEIRITVGKTNRFPLRSPLYLPSLFVAINSPHHGRDNYI